MSTQARERAWFDSRTREVTDKARESLLRWAAKQLREGGTVRALGALETAYCPTRQREDGPRGIQSPPMWRPEWTDGVGDAATLALSFSTSGWAWERPYTGDVFRLDRNGAFISAASSVSVAHGRLTHTGPGDSSTLRPGLYQVRVWNWNEWDRLPSPLGHAPVGSRVWVSHVRAGKLAKLFEDGRWPDCTVEDSWTSGAPVRIRDWAKSYVQALRDHAINKYGYKSPEYNEVKDSFSKAVTMMGGTLGEHGRRQWLPDVTARRPDWTVAIRDLNAVTIWNAADRCHELLPHLGPVALGIVDEMWVPQEAYTILTTRPVSTARGQEPRIIIDETGRKLGTWEVKSMDDDGNAQAEPWVSRYRPRAGAR